MQISAEVPEAEFKKIEKGQKVFITVDAAKKLATTGVSKQEESYGPDCPEVFRLKSKVL